MITYVAYFDKSTIRDHRLGLRFVGLTKTTPVVGERLHFEQISATVRLLCANLSLYGDAKHNPGLTSEIITEIKSFPDDSWVVFTTDGAYLLDPIK